MTNEEIKIKVIAIVMDKLNIKESEVTLDAAFNADLGADSLDTVEIIMEFEKKFDIKIHDADAEKVKTVGEAIACIENYVNNK